MNPIVIRLIAEGAVAVRSDLAGIGTAGVRMGTDMAKANAALSNATNDTRQKIAGLSVSVGDLRTHMAATGATLQGAIGHFKLTGQSATEAANAFRKAGRDEEDAARQLAAAAKQGAQAVKNANAGAAKSAKDSADAQKHAAQSLPVAFRSAASAASTMWANIRSGGKATGAEIDDVTGKMRNLDKAITQTRFEGINEKLGQVRNIGMGMIATGAAGAYAIGKGVQNAGTMEGYHNALTRQFGNEGGEDQLQRTKEFAKATPFSFEGAMKNQQMLAAIGFQRDELIPAMTALGNVAAAGGQGEEVLDRLAVNLGQIKNMEHPQEIDLKQFAYAGVNIEKIISAALGKQTNREEIKAMSGEDFVRAFVKGANMPTAQGGVGDAMEVQMNTLPGQISMLTDSFFQLGAVMGSYLLPPIKFVTSVLTWLSDAFQAIPAPMQAILSYGAALAVGFLLLGGGILVLGAVGAQAVISLGFFGISVAGAGTAAAVAGTEAAGASVGFGAVALALLPVALTIVLVIAALAALVGAFYLLYKGATWLWDKLTGKDKEVEAAGNKADEIALKNDNEQRDKRGQKQRTLREFVAGKEAGETVTDADLANTTYSSSDLDKIESNRQQSDMKSQMADAQRQMDALRSGAMSPTTPAALGRATLPVAAIPAAASFGSSSGIEALEDQVAQSRKKYDADSPQEELRLARRGEKHDRSALREAKATERAQNKTQRETERERKKAERADARERKRIEREEHKAAREAARNERITDRDDLAVTKARNANNSEDLISSLQDDLDAAHDAKDAARVRALTYQIENAKAEETYANAMAAAAQNDDTHRASQEEVARLNLQHDRRKAERTANKAGRSEERQGRSPSLLQNLIALRHGAGIYGLGDDAGADGARLEREQAALQQHNRGGINLLQSFGMFGKGSSLGDMMRNGGANGTNGNSSSTRAENAPLRIPLSFKEAAPSPTGRQRFEVFGVIEVDSPLMQALGART